MVKKKTVSKTERVTIAEERNRYAREIHDELAQNLTAIGLNLQFSLNLFELNPVKAKELINNSIKLLDDSSKELKQTIFEPATLSNLGIINCIKKFIENNNILNFSFNITGKERPLIPKQELYIWRLFKEFINNVTYNQNSKNVEILFNFEVNEPFMSITNEGFEIKIKSDRPSQPDLDILVKDAEKFSCKVEIKGEKILITIK